MAFNGVKTVLFLGLLSGLLMGVGFLLGSKTGLIIAFIFAIGMNFFSYFFSDKIVLKMYGAKEAKKLEHPKLYSMVEEVSKKAGIPMPKVFIINDASPNAFATGRNPKHAVVAATTGILSLLNEEELKGVIAHEISHVKNRDILIQTVAVTIASVISFIATMAQWAAIFGGGSSDEEGGSGGNIIGFLLLAILTPIIATLLQLALSRNREYLADESAAKLLHNGKGLSGALKKLETGIAAKPMRKGKEATASLFIANPFSMKGMISWLSTHPPIEKRVERLNGMKF